MLTDSEPLFSPLLELANYHILGRILYYVPYFAPIAPGKILSTFGGLMALVEALNALGVALGSNRSTDATHNKQGLGNRFTLAALAIQFFVILVFVSLAGVFHRRCVKANIHARAVSVPLTTLYVSMALIWIRCIYRFVEHCGNTNVQIDDLDSLKSLSPIVRYEWFFYVFEASLMLINSMLWNILHPGRYLPRSYHVHLSEDGMTEVEGEDEEDDRPMVAKAGYVLSFGVLFRKKRGTTQTTSNGGSPAADRQNWSVEYVIGAVLTFGLLPLFDMLNRKNKEKQEAEELNGYPAAGHQA